MAIPKPGSDHWLVRPGTIRGIWAVSLGVLALTVLGDLVVEHHPHFGIDGSFGFGAWFGFASCVVLIVFSKTLGAILKRADDYYDR
jgi:uncharacterized membrane protein YhdT